MTLSRREVVLQAFKTQLATIAGVTVARNTDDAIASPPALVMVDGGQTREGGSTGDGEYFGQDTYHAHVTVWGYLAAATDEALGTAISDLHAQVILIMSADRTLGGAAQYLREIEMPDPDWDREKGRRPNAAIEIHFDVEFTTKQGDPYAAP